MAKTPRLGVLAAVLVAIAIALWWYKASPYYAVAGLRNAALRGDTEDLGRRVDFVRLREEIKAQVSVQIIGNMTEKLSGNPFAALGLALATKMTDVMVDAMITPAGIMSLVEQRSDRKSEEISGFGLVTAPYLAVRRTGLDAFEIYSIDEEDRNITLRFNRDGLGWRLVGLKMPQEFLAAKMLGYEEAKRPTELAQAKWRFSESKDTMDDSVTVMLNRDADEEIHNRYSSVRPILYLRCMKNQFAVLINLRGMVDHDYRDDGSSVRIRFDDGIARSERWTVSTTREALFAQKAMAFLDSLRKAETFQFEWKQLGGGTSVAKFTKGDLDAQFGPFEVACGKALLVKVPVVQPPKKTRKSASDVRG